MFLKENLKNGLIYLKQDLDKKLYTLFFIYTLVGLGLYVLSGFLVFKPPSVATYHDEYTDKDINLVTLKLNTQGQKTITAHYAQNPKARFTLLLSHGNNDDLGKIQKMVRLFYHNGYSVFTYDYQGYGTSEGIATEGNTYKDIQAAYEYLINEAKIPNQKIILLGRSLGSGPSMELASKFPVGGVVLDSPYLTMFKVKTHISLFPIDQFDNESKISKISSPILIIHGTQDRIVPFWHGQRLYEKANGRKYALWFEGGGHSNLMKYGKDTYLKRLEEFAQSIESNSSLPKAIKVSRLNLLNPK